MLDGLAVFHRATALAFAGVLAGATVIVGLAAALALTRVLALAIMGLALLLVRECARAGADVGLAGLGSVCGAQGGNSAARHDAGHGRAREESFGIVVTFHLFFLSVVRPSASPGLLKVDRAVQIVRPPWRDIIPDVMDPVRSPGRLGN